MMKLVIGLIILIALGCIRELPPEEIPLPTKVCVKVQHHTWVIPDATIYVKYNTAVFPGYDKPAEFYDTSFKADKAGKGCLNALPEGEHWLVGFGYDSLYFPHHVFGSLPIKIDLRNRPVIDTILYVSE